MSSQSGPTRNLPHKPNLSQLRKQAKKLLHSYRAGKETAVAEVQRFERTPDPANFALADAQRVLARAYGFWSWLALKSHVEGINFAALIAAAEAGNVAAVRKLAAARPDLINPHHAEYRDSALHRAVLNRNEELTRVLMQLGADAHVGIWPHRDATSAYAIAIDREFSEIVAIIEQEEDNRRARLSHDATLPRAAVDLLREAVVNDRTAEAVSLIEADPALISACDLDGVTPLHLAAWKQNPELVGRLLDHGASPGEIALPSAELGSTPLDSAAWGAGWASAGRQGHFYFMENAHVDAAQFQETTRLLLHSGATLTPRAAVALGDREAVLQLHRTGRLANEIHMYRGGLIALAVRVNRIEMVATLLDLGFDPDESVVADDGGRSFGMPLWFASMCGRHEIAELLLTRGADVNAIVYACADPISQARDEQMTALLLKHGARITVEQLPDGEQGRETARAILAGTMPASSLNVEDPALADLAEQMLWATGDAEIVRLCLPHITRSRNDSWWNYVLIHTREPDKLKLLLEDGVDPDARGGEGYTALHSLAAGRPENQLIRATILLNVGASLRIRDTLLKSTPLGWACRWGRIELVKLYLERGVDVLETDAEQWATPLAWATKRGHHEIAAMLRSHGAES